MSAVLGGVFCCCCILCPLTSAQSSGVLNMTVVGQRNRTVALGSNISFACRYTSDGNLGVEYEWRYWELCSTGQKPSYQPKLVVQGRRSESPFGDVYSFAPTIPTGKGQLDGLLGTGNVSLTIFNTTTVFAATKCLVVVFSCAVVNQFNVEVSDETQVNFYDPARITAAPFERLVVSEQSVVDLACEAAGIPTPEQRWTKVVNSQQSVLPPGGYTFVGRLPSFVASAQSAGNYSCFVYNDYGNASKTIEVVVKCKPRVEALSPRVAQATGYYASLVCSATSDEPVTSAWWQLGERVVARSAAPAGAANGSNDDAAHDLTTNATDHDRLIMKKLAVSGAQYTSELLLGIVHSDYRQVYTCHFANTIGASSAAVELIASSKPRPTYGDGSVKPYRGEASSSAILRASLLLLLLGFLLHDLF